MPSASVAYVIDSLEPSGAEWSLLSMVPHLVEAGVEVEVVHFGARDGLGPRFTSAGATVTVVREASLPGRVRSLRRHLSGCRPDLVHTTLFQADIAGRVAARAAAVPVVSSLVNGAYGAEQRRSSSIPRWKIEAARALDAATAQVVARFHAISRAVADEMAPRLRIDPDRIDIVHRGRDPEVLGRRDDARRQRVRRSLGIPPDVPVILSAARHEPQKALDVAVDAFSRVRAHLPGAVLLIAGRQGTATSQLERAIARTRTDDAVRVLGWRDDVPDLLAAADAFVFPSRWEGLGSVLVEAMALEIPIVVSDLAVVRELLVDSAGAELAWFMPPDDAEAFATGLLDALRNAGDRPQRARDHFSERFTAERATAGVLEMYQRVLQR